MREEKEEDLHDDGRGKEERLQLTVLSIPDSESDSNVECILCFVLYSKKDGVITVPY